MRKRLSGVGERRKRNGPLPASQWRQSTSPKQHPRRIEERDRDGPHSLGGTGQCARERAVGRQDAAKERYTDKHGQTRTNTDGHGRARTGWTAWTAIRRVLLSLAGCGKLRGFGDGGQHRKPSGCAAPKVFGVPYGYPRQRRCGNGVRWFWIRAFQRKSSLRNNQTLTQSRQVK